MVTMTTEEMIRLGVETHREAQHLVLEAMRNAYASGDIETASDAIEWLEDYVANEHS